MNRVSPSPTKIRNRVQSRQGQRDPWVSQPIQVERAETRGRVARVVDRKFHCGEQSAPVPRPLGTYAPQSILDGAIHALRLAVRLWMVGRGHVQTCPHELEQLLPKGRRESGVPIRYNGLGESMQTKHFVKEDLCGLTCRDSLTHSRKMHHLTQAADKHQDAGVAALIFG